MEHGQPVARELPWVIVRVGRSRLGIPSRLVREILALPPVARVPGLPPDLPGVVTWRGRVLPLIDLMVRLQVARDETPHGPRMAVVVSAEEDARERAFAVDAIDGVEGLEPGSVQPLPPGLEAHGAMVRESGRLRRDGAVVLLLDVAETLGLAARRRTGPTADLAFKLEAPVEEALAACQTPVEPVDPPAASAHPDSLAMPAEASAATPDETAEPVPASPRDDAAPQPPLPERRPKAPAARAANRTRKTRPAAVREATASGTGSRSPRRRTAS